MRNVHHAALDGPGDMYFSLGFAHGPSPALPSLPANPGDGVTYISPVCRDTLNPSWETLPFASPAYTECFCAHRATFRLWLRRGSTTGVGSTRVARLGAVADQRRPPPAITTSQPTLGAAAVAATPWANNGGVTAPVSPHDVLLIDRELDLRSLVSTHIKQLRAFTTLPPNAIAVCLADHWFTLDRPSPPPTVSALTTPVSPPVSSAELLPHLRQAIQKGAPLYNSGDIRGCFALYQTAAIVALAAGWADAATTKSLQGSYMIISYFIAISHSSLVVFGM